MRYTEKRMPVQKRQSSKSSSQKGKLKKLRVIPLGGLGEIGKNITALEYGDNIIVIDCGLGFPSDDMLGIDLVVPDVTYLQNNIEKVKGIKFLQRDLSMIERFPMFCKNSMFRYTEQSSLSEYF